MDNKELQVENGNFTRIINPLIDHIIQVPFRGCELAVAIFIIRKTYGYNKTEDQISLTQFENGILRTRPSIVKALKNLQLVNIALLVKRGDSSKHSNIWKINKYYNTWKLVNIAKLVKVKHRTSKELDNKLVKTALHTKDNIQKTITKETIATNVAWSLKDQINKMATNEKDPRMWIIALYWVLKEFRIESAAEFSIALKRELRPAGELKAYPKDRLKETMSWLKQNADFKWTLETVGKYINEDLSKISTNKSKITIIS